MSGSPAVEFTVECVHGILVIEPLGSRAEHEDWDVMADGVHLESDSVFIAVNPSMEGAVTTSVLFAHDHEVPPADLERIFEGQLKVPSSTLLIGDSDRNIEIRLPVRSGACDVSAWVDVPGFAKRVLVILEDETA
jgi:hypothetical protein